MTEIKRYDVVSVDGVPAHRPSESGRWVKHEDHAALQEQLSSYSLSAGQADQRKAESDAVRVALGLSADADDVAPCDLVDAIAALQEQVRALATECKAVYDHALEEGYQFYPGGIEYTDAALREILADGAMACGVHLREWYDYQVEERAEEFAAAIRAGEQP